MKVRRYLPAHPFLRKMLKHIAFQEIEPAKDHNQWMRIFPNCTTNLCITLDKNILTLENGLMSNNLSTSCIRPVTFNRGKRIEMIVMQFQPFAFHSFSGVLMKEFTNQFPTLEEFFPSSVLEELYERLYESSDDVNRKNILERFLLRWWKIKNTDERIPEVVQKISQAPVTEIDLLARHVNLRNRQLRKLFDTHLGVSPKYFAKLIRFNHAVAAITRKEDYSLTQIGLEKGYFDQAHFIKDFREFGGLSPGQFRKMKDKNAVFYNFQSAEDTTL